jgi:hypothetical protein
MLVTATEDDMVFEFYAVTDPEEALDRLSLGPRN